MGNIKNNTKTMNVDMKNVDKDSLIVNNFLLIYKSIKISLIIIKMMKTNKLF
jgi:hypothetical protein